MVALMEREDALVGARRLEIHPFRGDIQTCIIPRDRIYSHPFKESCHNGHPTDI
jgi:hypothetical protein